MKPKIWLIIIHKLENKHNHNVDYDTTNNKYYCHKNFHIMCYLCAVHHNGITIGL